jgi:hypothetical protein
MLDRKHRLEEDYAGIGVLFKIHSKTNSSDKDFICGFSATCYEKIGTCCTRIGSLSGLNVEFDSAYNPYAITTIQPDLIVVP